MSIFKGRESITRSEFRQILREDSGSIPGSRRRFGRRERLAFEKEVFDRKKYGPFISKSDFQDVLEQLEKGKLHSETRAERLKRKRRFDYLSKFLKS